MKHLLPFIVMLLCAVAVKAQPQSWRLVGSVSDATLWTADSNENLPISGVRLTLRQEGKRRRLSAVTTNKEGCFQLAVPRLADNARYQLCLTARGYRKECIQFSRQALEDRQSQPGCPDIQGCYYFMEPVGSKSDPEPLLPREQWDRAAKNYKVKPVAITHLNLVVDAGSRYAVPYICYSDTLQMGTLLQPKADSASMALFNRCVTLDLWDRPVGISPGRYMATLADVNEAEQLLAQQMRKGILPQLNRKYQRISNPDNYLKYRRTYGFYYNQEGQRCVYIELTYGKGFWRHPYIFTQMWDGCDIQVYINLNLDTRQVIRAYPSTCQSY